MRSYSFFTILLLCFALILIDTAAFYWLQSITQLFGSEFLKLSINIVFWLFTSGLVIGIIVLKLRLNAIHPMRKHLFISRLYGLVISSLIPKFIFVVVISTLYFANFVFSDKESLLVIPIVGLFSGLLPFVIIIYAISKAKYNFKIYRHTVAFQKLPEAFDNLKIVHLSDLHLGNFNYRYKILERAVELINEEDPDIIVFTGDLVNNYAWELNGWDKVFSKLKAKKGKYAVLGNHDYGDYSEWESESKKIENFEAIKAFFSKIDFTLLLNEFQLIEKDDVNIAIVGVENWGKPPFKQYGNLEKAIKDINPETFKILLSHDPTHWQAEVTKVTNIALTLSGHTHGMQAGITIANKQWSPIKYKFKEWAGLYKNGNQYLYVNRGLGWLGFPGRLGMRPEITIIELTK